MTQQLVQEPLLRFCPYPPAEEPADLRPDWKPLTCETTGKPLEPWLCFCCTGYQCPKRYGAYKRLEYDTKANPGKYAGMPFVYAAMGKAAPEAEPKEAALDADEEDVPDAEEERDE